MERLFRASATSAAVFLRRPRRRVAEPLLSSQKQTTLPNPIHDEDLANQFSCFPLGGDEWQQ